MATASVPFSPMATTNAAGLFDTTAAGLVQGTFLDDPAIRNELAGGTLAAAETIPMWGGVALFENIAAAITGNSVGRTADLAHLAGFSVFNQAGNWLNTPQSPVPQGATGMQVNFFRMGSGARIVVACDPALVSLITGATNAQVSWDFTNQKLIAYNATPGALPVKVLSVQTAGAKTVAYDSGTGATSWVYTANACAIILI